MSDDRPKYPIQVFFSDEKQDWLFDNEVELAYTLEFFDSENPAFHATKTDSLGRSVVIKVENFELRILKLKT